MKSCTNRPSGAGSVTHRWIQRSRRCLDIFPRPWVGIQTVSESVSYALATFNDGKFQPLFLPAGHCRVLQGGDSYGWLQTCALLAGSRHRLLALRTLVPLLCGSDICRRRRTECDFLLGTPPNANLGGMGSGRPHPDPASLPVLDCYIDHYLPGLWTDPMAGSALEAKALAAVSGLGGRDFRFVASHRGDFRCWHRTSHLARANDVLRDRDSVGLPEGDGTDVPARRCSGACSRSSERVTSQAAAVVPVHGRLHCADRHRTDSTERRVEQRARLHRAGAGRQRIDTPAEPVEHGGGRYAYDSGAQRGRAIGDGGNRAENTENTGEYRKIQGRKIQGQPELRYLFRWSLLLRSLFQNGANRSARSLAWRRSLRNATQFRLSRYSPFRSFVACFHGRRSRTSSDENGGAGRRREVAVSARYPGLEEETRQLKQLLAERSLEVDFFKGALQKIAARRQADGGTGETASTTKCGR